MNIVAESIGFWELPKPKERKPRIVKEKVHTCEVVSDPDDKYCSD